MKKNMALGDRIVRMLVAIVFVVLFFSSDIEAPWPLVLAGIAVVMAVTAYLGSCPLYTLMGIDTRQFRDDQAPVKKTDSTFTNV